MKSGVTDPDVMPPPENPAKAPVPPVIVQVPVREYVFTPVKRVVPDLDTDRVPLPVVKVMDAANVPGLSVKSSVNEAVVVSHPLESEVTVPTNVPVGPPGPTIAPEIVMT